MTGKYLCPMPEILLQSDGGVAIVTLNRPDVLNSFNRDMARQLREAFDRIAGDDSLRLL